MVIQLHDDTMQSSRQGMRVGRAKFRAGDVDLAIHIWTKALESAYTAQDYAAMYVLSKNLGDAFTSLATEQQQQPLPKQKQRAATAVLEALQKSIDYYKYALNVIDECALLDVLGDERHLVLTRSAGHVHATLKRQEMTMEKLQKLPPATEEQPCTTCEELFEHLVLDDSDGCLYCQVCYDAFYASVEGVEFEHSFANREVLTAPPSELELAHELRAAAELSISDSSETKAEREDAIEEQSDGVANASSSSVTSEAANEDAEILSGLSTVSSATDSHSKAIKQTRTGEATAPLEQREPTTRARTTTPQVYSIPELLGLRTQSLVVRCPDAILSSPVARGVNSSTTSGSAKKPTDRKNSSTKQSKR